MKILNEIRYKIRSKKNMKNCFLWILICLCIMMTQNVYSHGHDHAHTDALDNEGHPLVFTPHSTAGGHLDNVEYKKFTLVHNNQCGGSARWTSNGKSFTYSETEQDSTSILRKLVGRNNASDYEFFSYANAGSAHECTIKDEGVIVQKVKFYDVEYIFTKFTRISADTEHHHHSGQHTHPDRVGNPDHLHSHTIVHTGDDDSSVKGTLDGKPLFVTEQHSHDIFDELDHLIHWDGVDSEPAGFTANSLRPEPPPPPEPMTPIDSEPADSQPTPADPQPTPADPQPTPADPQPTPADPQPTPVPEPPPEPPPDSPAETEYLKRHEDWRDCKDKVSDCLEVCSDEWFDCVVAGVLTEEQCKSRDDNCVAQCTNCGPEPAAPGAPAMIITKRKIKITPNTLTTTWAAMKTM